MGVIGFIASMGTGKLLEYVNGKYTLFVGLVLTVLAPIPSALNVTGTTNFWVNNLATSLISISAVSFIFVTTSTTILTSVPVEVKSLCGGMLNTAFQIGSGVALAISAATTEAVDIKKGHDLDRQYSTGLWCSTGLAGLRPHNWLLRRPEEEELVRKTEREEMMWQFDSINLSAYVIFTQRPPYGWTIDARGYIMIG